MTSGLYSKSFAVAVLVWCGFSLCHTHAGDTVNDGTTSCADAWSALEESASDVCDSFGLTWEQIQADACPADCQAALDLVLQSCEPGSVYDRSLPSFPFYYQEALLFHEFGPYNLGNQHWTSCNYGYEPTECDLALIRLDSSRFDFFSSALFEDSTFVDPACVKDSNEQTCSQECQELIQGVARECDGNDGAQFAPNAGYLDQTYSRIDWEYPTSMEYLGFNPNIFDTLGSLSFSCWVFYEDSVSQTGNGSSDGNGGTATPIIPPTTAPLSACEEEVNALFEANPSLQIQFDAMEDAIQAHQDLKCGAKSEIVCDIGDLTPFNAALEEACGKAGGKIASSSISYKCKVDGLPEENVFGWQNRAFCVAPTCKQSDLDFTVGAAETFLNEITNVDGDEVISNPCKFEASFSFADEGDGGDSSGAFVLHYTQSFSFMVIIGVVWESFAA